MAKTELEVRVHEVWGLWTRVVPSKGFHRPLMDRFHGWTPSLESHQRNYAQIEADSSLTRDERSRAHSDRKGVLYQLKTTDAPEAEGVSQLRNTVTDISIQPTPSSIIPNSHLGPIPSCRRKVSLALIFRRERELNRDCFPIRRSDRYSLRFVTLLVLG